MFVNWGQKSTICPGHYEASKANVITCLPNGEERCVSFLKEEELVSAMARELGVRRTQICVSFTDNVVGMGLTAEDCGIVNNSRLTVTFIVDEVIRPPTNIQS